MNTPPDSFTPPASLLAGTPADQWTIREPLKMPKAALRQLATFGHLAKSFLEAQQLFLKRASKPNVFAEIKPWLEGVSLESTSSFEDDGTFVSLFNWRDGQLQCETLVLDQASTASVLKLWQRLEPESASLAALPTPAFANASLWSALLRLRPLREFWERELGRSHWAALCTLLPDAWALTQGELPHGAVIPRLEIANWTEFSACIPKERSFLLSESTVPACKGTTATQENIVKALEAASTLSVVTEVPPSSGTRIAGVYERKGKRTELTGSFAFHEPVSIHRLTSG